MKEKIEYNTDIKKSLLSSEQLETLKTTFDTETKNVFAFKKTIQPIIDNVIQRTQAGDLPYEEALSLTWKQIQLFSEDNVWHLITHSRVSIAEVKKWGIDEKCIVAHPLIKERLDDPDVLLWIDIIISQYLPFFGKPQITQLVQSDIIPWEELFQVKPSDEMFRLLLNDDVLNLLLDKSFTFEELKTEKAGVVMLAKGWVERKDLVKYTEEVRNRLITDGVKVLSNEKNNDRITVYDLLNFNKTQLDFVFRFYFTILYQTEHTAATLRNIPLRVCEDILKNYAYARDEQLGAYNTDDVLKIVSPQHVILKAA